MDAETSTAIALFALLVALAALFGALCNKGLINDMKKQIEWLLSEEARRK
jgi:hypothetical protein